MWWMVAALAAPPLAQGWNLVDRGCYDDAVRMSGEALQAEPEHVGWHRLRENALRRADYSAYRSHARQLEVMGEDFPDHVGLRVARASAMLSESDVDCDGFAELLQGPFDDPEERYEVLRLELSVGSRCEGDDEPLKAELRSLRGVPQATSLALLWDLRADPASVSVEALQQELDRWPARADAYADVLWGEEKKGPAPLRKTVLAAAETWVDSDDPYELYAAGEVLRAAGKKVPSDLDERLQEVLPCRGSDEPQEEGEATEAWRETVRDADRRPTHEAALEALQALERKVPSRPVDRAHWLEAMVERHDALGQDDEAYRLSKELMDLTPDDGDRVNGWAYRAAVRGEQLEEALTRLEKAFADRADFAYDASGREDFERARFVHLRQTSNWEDTRCWLLHRLGRDEEAATACDRALLARTGGVVYAHAGLVHATRGDDERAFQHLRRAFELGISEEALSEEAEAALEPLAMDRGVWHPEGYDGWVGVLGRKPSGEERATPAKQHPLIGKTFPVAAAEALGGGEVQIVGAEAKATVVDVWATWCGPCVAGMPHLQEVAATHADRGVRVVGLSVDEQIGAAKRFYKGADVAYELAWHGRTGFDDLQISGIPAMFVMDADGVVTHQITGFGGEGDTRLETALEEVLGGKRK